MAGHAEVPPRRTLPSGMPVNCGASPVIGRRGAECSLAEPLLKNERLVSGDALSGEVGEVGGASGTPRCLQMLAASALALQRAVLMVCVACLMCPALARQIVIPPTDTLTFYENVAPDGMFKLIYGTRPGITLRVTDPSGAEIILTENHTGTVYSLIPEGGRVQMDVVNRKSEPCYFSYKCPDPSKEVMGSLGYVKDTDLVSDLVRVFDDLSARQQAFIAQAAESEQTVGGMRFWMRALMAGEFLLSSFAMYRMHRDLMQMFERKQRI